MFDTQGDGEDEEFAAACRLADSVLLCYKASDLQSLQSAVGKWFNLVRKFSPHSPVVLVGCKGDAKEFSVNTILASEEMVKPVNAVMHVETSSATSSKSVKVAFQVAALACFTHKHKDQENHKRCQLQRVTYSVPNQLSVKLEDKPEQERTVENLYSNFPAVTKLSCTRADLIVPDLPTSIPLSVDTQSTKPKKKDKSHKNAVKNKCVTIECQRLNKDKVLEKINVEVSIEVFEALREMNPELLNNKEIEEKEQPNSADFYLEKSVQEVKSALQCLKLWRSGNKYKFSDKETTCL